MQKMNSDGSDRHNPKCAKAGPWYAKWWWTIILVCNLTGMVILTYFMGIGFCQAYVWVRLLGNMLSRRYKFCADWRVELIFDAACALATLGEIRSICANQDLPQLSSEK